MVSRAAARSFLSICIRVEQWSSICCRICVIFPWFRREFITGHICFCFFQKKAQKRPMEVVDGNLGAGGAPWTEAFDTNSGALGGWDLDPTTWQFLRALDTFNWRFLGLKLHLACRTWEGSRSAEIFLVISNHRFNFVFPVFVVAPSICP